MDVKIGNFRIESDKRQMTLFFERKKGTFQGIIPDDEPIEEFIGHYSTLESLFKALPSRMLMRSDAATIQEVLDELRFYRTLIQNALKGA